MGPRRIGVTVRQVMPDLPADLIPSQDGWVNINPTGAMNAPHDHPGAFWSGVYYVQVPPPGAYFDPINWHRTALHELCHWSG